MNEVLTPVRRQSVIVVAGCPSYGKTTYALRYLVNGKFAVRFLFDPDPGEFNSDLGEFADRLGLEPTVSPFHMATHIVRDVAHTGAWLAFDPHPLFQGELENAFNFWCDFALEKSLQVPGDKILVAHDVFKYCTPQMVPAPLKTIVQSGSKRRLFLLVDTQEPQRLNMTIKSGMSEVVCFRLQGEGPLSFAEEFGFNRDEIANLDRLQFVARNMESGGELRGRIPL